MSSVYIRIDVHRSDKSLYSQAADKRRTIAGETGSYLDNVDVTTFGDGLHAEIDKIYDNKHVSATIRSGTI